MENQLKIRFFLPPVFHPEFYYSEKHLKICLSIQEPEQSFIEPEQIR